MNVFVAFKYCPDVEKMNQNDYVILEKMGVDTHFLPNVLNCYDESNLEIALRLSESHAGIEKTAFTIGSQASEQVLDSLLALGYEHGVRVKADADTLRFNPEAISGTICTFISEHPQDVVLMGREAPLGNNASTSQLVAAHLQWPLVSSAIDIAYIDEKSLSVDIQNDGAIYRQKVVLPCVISLGNAVISKMRMPTLKERLQSKGRTIEYAELTPLENEVFPAPFAIRIPNRRRKSYVSQEKGQAAVDDIYAIELKKRLGDI